MALASDPSVPRNTRITMLRHERSPINLRPGALTRPVGMSLASFGLSPYLVRLRRSDEQSVAAAIVLRGRPRPAPVILFLDIPATEADRLRAFLRVTRLRRNRRL